MSDDKQQDAIDDNTVIVDAKTGRPVSNSRRKFLTNAGMFSAGLVGSSVLAACSDGDSNISLAQDSMDDGRLDPNDPNVVVINGPTDQAVLNFALNLEYLEAEFYLRALGRTLSDDLRGNSDARVVGGSPVPFQTPLILNYAREIAADEEDHVRFLRSALGDGAVPAPAINFTDAFSTAAVAAGLPADFNPFNDELSFLLGAFIFEDVGVSAYKGGSVFIRNRTFLEAAAGLLSVEAYHAGLVRTVLRAGAADNPMGVDVPAVVDMISDARDSLDGSDDIDQGISDRNVGFENGNDAIGTNIVPTDANGLTYSRSPFQVHNIVYLNPEEVTQGGFFPEGTNGTLTSSADQTGMGDGMGDDSMSG